MLAAAKYQHGEETDVRKRFFEDGTFYMINNSIAPLFGESVICRGGQVKSDGLETEEIYVEIWHDPRNDCSRAHTASERGQKRGFVP